MKHILTLFAVFLMPLLCFAQKEDYVWVMGNNIIDFKTTPPTVRANGDFAPEPGLTSVCDKDGNLKYWINGNRVYNKNSEEIYTSMSIQDIEHLNSLTLFPMPGSETNYIYMHLDYKTKIIHFTEIDGSKDELHPEFKDFASLSYNGCSPVLIQKKYSRDFWLLHQDTNTFNVYSITKNGLFLHSTKTFDKEIYDDYFFRINDSRIANSQTLIYTYVLGMPDDLLYMYFDFDCINGLITDMTLYHNGSDFMEGEAFTQNDKFFYFFFCGEDYKDYDKIFRCPVDKLKEIDALKKYRKVAYNSMNHSIDDIKMGPDGNIYFLDSYNPEYVGVIYNSEDDNPIVNPNGIKMAQPSKTDRWAAMFPYTYHYPFAVSYTRDCHDFTFSFSESEYESIVWNFGDGTAEVKDVEKPTHTFADDGKYTVSLTVTLTDGVVRDYSTDVEITTPKIPKIIVE